jgi:acetoin utilization protein AcuB
MQDRFCMMTARDFMTPGPVHLIRSATVGEALGLLRELDVRHLPIVDEDGEVVGMLSDRDLRGLGLPWEPTERTDGRFGILVSEVMSTDVLSVDADAAAHEIVDLMLEFKVGAVPVVDAENRLVGIVSYIDMLRWLQPGLAAEHDHI